MPVVYNYSAGMPDIRHSLPQEVNNLHRQNFFLFIKFVYGNINYAPQNKEQLAALKAIDKALKVSVETSSYNPDFVAR
jgi:hypothetical protein